MLWRLRQKNSFSLLEVMISLMIISITVTTLSGVEGVAIKSNRKTIIYTRAVVLANKLMSEIEIKTKYFGFEYLDTLEKKQESVISDGSYKNWKWVQEVKDINFPIGNLMKDLMGGDAFGEDSSKDNSNEQKQLDPAAINTLMVNLEQLIGESMRQVIITVRWPVKAGKAYGQFKLLYYPVDFKMLETYKPAF